MKKEKIKVKVKKNTNKNREEKVKSEKGRKTYNLVRGMHDILPKEEKYWKKIYHTAENLAEYFQFGRIDTPVVEEAGLFVRSLGRGTDVVDKEMYIFEDRDSTRVCLRPESTAAVVRAYIMHGMWNNSQPVKMWYWGPMFRHDRPQAGRYRQFYQAGYEVIGTAEPISDAELIVVAYNLFQELHLPVEVRINSIGTTEDRQRYKAELTNYYRSKRSYLCEDCRQRISKNPLRLLDCKAEQCQPIKEDAPQIIDWLSEASKSHLMKVLEYLDELSIPYVLTPTLVRGLDYYTHTVFEFYPTGLSAETAQSALGGGGRYDLLVEELGGRPTSAAGLSLGVERIVSAIKAFNEQNKTSWPAPAVDVFFAQLGDRARSR
ncbi:MAG TPA: histidine--tRNA ligase, partial [Patescibacteria group bacterium]|nr:histidine--tRNA ligase [Patescibacteria group bacterium]